MEPGEMPEWLTPAWLSSQLGGDVGGVTHERIGDGLVGMNLRLRLHDHDPALPSSLVAKLPSTDPTSRATGVALRNYEREVRFYADIAPTVDIRVPHCHHGEWHEDTGDFVLLLEDMAPAVQGDQVTGCDVDVARTTVTELARLHGPRWDDASLHDVDWLSRRTPDDGATLQGMWSVFIAGFEATYRRHLTDEQARVLAVFGTKVAAWVSGRPAAPLAVTHGDFRLDNLLFGTDAGGPPVTAVDWQTPGHGSPIGDLSYFVGAGLLPEDRRAHERELIDAYADALDGYGVAVDGEWLWEQYRRESFAGVVMAVVASQIVGSSDRSEAMFTAMATRHLQHAIDLDALDLV